MHGGTELIMVCVKPMGEAATAEFVRSTDAHRLAGSMQTDREDHLDGYCEIIAGFDKAHDTHRVEVKFFVEIEDKANVESWCLREGFQILESEFRSRG